MLNKPHYCPEWDYAWIEPGDSEMEACICVAYQCEPGCCEDTEEGC